MHFEGQHLGGAVRLRHIVAVGHAAVRPLGVPPRPGNEHKQAVAALLDVQGTVAEVALPD